MLKLCSLKSSYFKSFTVFKSFFCKINLKFVPNFFPVEHTFSIIGALNLSSDECYTIRSKEEAYFRKSFTELFSIFPYSVFLGIFAQIMNSFCMISWNFVNIYLMAISILISEKFCMINQKLVLNSKLVSNISLLLNFIENLWLILYSTRYLPFK